MSTSTMEKTDTATIARQRSDIYGFLAMVYRQEVNSDFLKQIKDPRFLGVFDLFKEIRVHFLPVNHGQKSIDIASLSGHG